MRRVSQLRRAISTLATAGLVLTGIHLGAAPAQAKPSLTTRLTALSPAGGTAVVDPGPGTTIRLAVDLCNPQQVCAAPVAFPDPDPESILIQTNDATDLVVRSDADPGTAIPVTLTAAPAVEGGGVAAEGGQAIASFDTGPLTSETTFTFSIGMGGNPASPWVSFLTNDPGSMQAAVAQGASVSIIVKMSTPPSVDTNNLQLDPMSVGTYFEQQIDWSNYVAGTDTSSVTFHDVTGLPAGLTAAANASSGIVISGTPTGTGSGTAYLNLLNGEDAVPGTNTMLWTVDPTPTPTETPDFCALNPDDPSCGEYIDPCVTDPTAPECQPLSDDIDTTGLSLGTLTVGSPYSNEFDLSPFITSSGATYVISGVTGLPDGIEADYSGTTLTLTGTPTSAGSGEIVLTLSDGSNVLSGYSGILWTVEAASFTPGHVTTPTPREWNLAADIGAFSVRAELYTSGFDWSDGGKITVTGLPQGMSLARENDGFGPDGLWSTAGASPSASVVGASAISGTGTFDVSYTDKFETQTVTVEYTVTDHDSLNANGFDYYWNDSPSISWNAWGTAPLTRAVLFVDESPVAAYPLTGSNRDSIEIPAADFRNFSDIYATTSFTVRTYYSIQLDGETMPTLATPYSAETSFNRLARALSLGTTTQEVYAGSPGADMTYNGPSGYLIVAYRDGVAVDSFTKNDGDTWRVDFTDYGLADQPHFVNFQVFNLAGNAAAPAYNSGTALTAVSIWFIPNSVINNITLDPMQVGTPFTQTLDMADYTTGFRWDGGGGAYLNKLPAGLTYEVLNATSPNGTWSVSGQAPVVRIYGTPTVAGDYSIGITVENSDWGYDASAITGTIAAEPIPAIAASSTDLFRNDTTTLTYDGPDGSMICAEITISMDLFDCRSVNNGQQVSYDYNTLMMLYTNIDWNLSSWSAEQTVQFRVWTPTAMQDQGLDVDNNPPDASAAPSNSVSVTLEPSATAAFTEEFVLPQFHVGAPVELTFDMTDYTTGFDWTNEGDMYLEDNQLPPGLSWDYGTGDSGAPVLYIWGTPTEAGVGTLYVDVYDNFWGEVETDLAWSVAQPVTLQTDTSTLTEGQTATLTFSGPDTEFGVFFIDGFYVGGMNVVDMPGYSAADGTFTLDYSMFADFAQHVLSVKLYASDPAQTPDLNWDLIPADASVDITFAARVDNSSMTSPALAPAIVNQPYETTNDLTPYTLGFDFSKGGHVEVVGLPDTITASLDNPGTDSTWSADNEAPVLKLSGTPTVINTYEVTITTTDTFGHSASATSLLSVGSLITLDAPNLPPMQVNTPFTFTFDLSTLSSGYDWSAGGYVELSSLPLGLNFEIVNADPEDPTWSVPGEAPVVRIFGTPELEISDTFSIYVADDFGNQKAVPVNYTVHAASSMSAEPANMSPDQSSTITWRSPFAETLAVAYLDGQIVKTWTLDEETTSFAAAYSDFNAFGDMYADRNLEIHLFTSEQWETGAAFPTYASGYDATLSMTLFATPTTLTPSEQVVAHDGSAVLTYTGSQDRTYGLFLGNSLIAWGSVSDYTGGTDTITMAWDYFGSSSDRSVTFRVYDANYGIAVPAPSWSTNYAATADMMFAGYTPPAGTISAPTLPGAWVGVPYSEPFDVSTLAGNMFDWTYGGGVDIQGLPAGLTYEVLNPYDVGETWSADGEAPVVRIYGVPTETSVVMPSLYVEDDNGTTASTEFALPVSEVSFTATPDDLRQGMTSTLSYNGPVGLMFCAFFPDQSDLSYGCSDASDVIGELPYDIALMFNQGPINAPWRIVFRTYPVMYTDQPTELDPTYNDGSYLTSTTVTFDATPQLTLPTFDNLTVGVPFDQSIDLNIYASHFDWSQGGTATVNGLPDGLHFEITNAGPDHITTGGDIAPVVRIFGTPTTPTDGAVTFTLSANSLTGDTASTDGSLTVDPAAPTPQLSPASQALSFGTTIGFTYDGPGTRLAALWLGDRVITWGPVDQLDSDLMWRWLAAVSGDSTVDHQFSLRVYAETFQPDGTQPSASDPAESTATIEFKGNVPTVDTIDLGNLTVGVAVDQTINLATYTHGFDWTVYGGRATVDGLPAGLTAEMTNAVNGAWTSADTAPVLHVSGTPLEAGPYAATVTVFDAAFGEGGQSAAVTLEGSVAAEAISLSPAELLVSFGDAGFFNYSGPANRAVAFFNSANQVVMLGNESLLENIRWGFMGRNTEVSLTVRVYPFAFDTQTPTFGTDYAAQSTVTFAANSPAVSAMDFGPLTVGVAYDKTFDMADYTTGFDWTINGGRATITDLPAGLHYEVTNAVHGDFTASGFAPIIRIVGTPTSSGGYESTVTVYDSVYGDSGQSASTYPGGSVATAIELSPSSVDITFNNGLDVTYTGPGDRLAAVFDGDNVVVWDRADALVGDIRYGFLAGYLGGTSADHEFQLAVFDMPTTESFPAEYGMPAAATTINFKSHAVTLEPLDFGRVQVGVAYDKTFALADLQTGFDWTGGGWAHVGDLPAGLQGRVVNAADPGGEYSTSAPIVEVYGTPTEAGSFTPSLQVGDTLYGMGGQVATTSSPMTVVPAAMLEALPLGQMVQGTAFTQTLDMADFSANFDWSQGGSVNVSELPAGLSSEITNPMEKGPVVSTNGQAPKLRVFGTPTVHGEFTVTVTLTDEFGATASVNVPVVITTGLVPSDPAAQVKGAGTTATFTIPGLADGATITPGTKVAGVQSVSVVEGDVLVHVLSTFSGLINQPVTVSQDGTDTVVHLVIKVYPTATKNNTFTLRNGATYVHWSGSPNAHGYKVLVNGHVACSTAAKVTSCTVKGLLGPKAAIVVVVVGGNNFTIRTSARYVKSAVVSPFGAVLFAADSAKLTTASKLAIHNYAVAIAKQGFTTVAVEGYVAHWPGNTSAADKAHRIALSKARAAVVRTYLVTEFKKLGVKVSVQTLGNGGSHPTVSNTLSTSAAGNRRADLSVS